MGVAGTDEMNVGKFIADQLSCWPEAAARFDDLERSVLTRDLMVSGRRVVLQHNSHRAVSTAARVDSASIASRQCFLCRDNRPAVQSEIVSGRYEILVNPFPIFPGHLTIAERTHTPQTISGRFGEMLEFAEMLNGFTVFYNGPHCGASAPDHAHFQAAPSRFFPVWDEADSLSSENPVAILPRTPAAFIIKSGSISKATEYFGRLLDMISAAAVGEEPMINLLAKKEGDCFTIACYPRRRHRADSYGTELGCFLISPASIDVAGVVVVPRRADFDSMTGDVLAEIFRQTCFTPAELKAMIDPSISVGILEAEKIRVDLHGSFICDDATLYHSCSLEFDSANAGIRLTPLDPEATMTIRNVTIGIDFHWQQQYDLTYEGSLEIVHSETQGRIIAINHLPIERYLMSVISSEMNANAPLEFLKAHAVISRSWALAQVRGVAPHDDSAMIDTDGELIKWYDHSAHSLFDVCSDDHCQRYQGIPERITPQVEAAISATEGEVLMFEGKICDARFSKCCGGVTERFSTCWQPIDFTYLPAVADTPQSPHMDLSGESDARKWITSRPDAFCADPSEEVLASVLNSYDRSTPHLYRWRVDYSAEELADIIRQRSGIDFGSILRIEPLSRGASGRIDRLRIVGSLRTRIIGKELEIRRTLSRSHLYSSAFVVEPGELDSNGVPRTWTIAGAGWGHGVGLCQIGAAVMASQGYDYKTILSHYFPGSELKKI